MVKMIENFLSINRLSKEYKGKNPLIVFKDFNLNISKGDIHCIFGPNGCGKSTLMNIIAGIDNDWDGKVLIDGHQPVPGSVGFLFQDYKTSLFPWLNCIDNMTFKYILNGTNQLQRNEIANKLVSELGLNLNLKKYPYEYSGGQQQLIALARALCDSPNILIMDEPYSALDANMRINIRNKSLQILQKLNLTVLMVSHNLEDCIYCADKVTFLSNVPAKIIKTIEIPLDRTKTHRNVYSNEFANVINKCREILKDVSEL